MKQFELFLTGFLCGCLLLLTVHLYNEGTLMGSAKRHNLYMLNHIDDIACPQPGRYAYIIGGGHNDRGGFLDVECEAKH